MCESFDMIQPYESEQIKSIKNQKAISFGVSSYGYDVRCADEFKVFTNINSSIVDPKNFDENNFVEVKDDICLIPPNSFALARTIEYFRIPRNVLTICLGKSTYARCGIIVNVTPLEPEWEGHVTLEFSNTTPCLRKFMQTRELRNLFSCNQMSFATHPTKTGKENISDRKVLHYRRCSTLYSVGFKASDKELIQYLKPVGLGPSLKRCPRWDSHLLHINSILSIPYDRSFSFLMPLPKSRF